MDRQPEQTENIGVHERLAERFPELESDIIAEAVRVARSNLTDAVVAMAPVLVENIARDRLSTIARHLTSPDGQM